MNKGAVRRGWLWLLEILFPARCPLCQASATTPHALCETCHTRLPDMPELVCRRCGALTPRPQAECAACRGVHHAPEAFLCAFLFESSIRTLIHAFKYKDQGELATLLGGLCWERLGRQLQQEAPELVIPLPLHWRRLWWRRYNQAALLAGVLAGYLDKPLLTGGLRRHRHTRSQTSLDGRHRHENVRGAFTADPGQIRGRHVLLVDDVTTTGSTLAAATFALKHAGARRVAVVCLAHAASGLVDPDSTLGGDHA
ncbi:MAG: ComF family protein [Magnetococcus sp. DMHC-1]|nr:ComF family protein [Magnetococcales bacterium]